MPPIRRSGQACRARGRPAACSQAATCGSSRGIGHTRQATESIGLLARYVFHELGYRRLEWKCNDLNAASKRAALRAGYERWLDRANFDTQGRQRRSLAECLGRAA